MVQLAIEDTPEFALTDLEIRRSGKSYSIDTVRAIQQAEAAGLPTFVPATTGTQISRVLRLSRELTFTPVIVGGHEAGRVVDELVAAKASVA